MAKNVSKTKESLLKGINLLADVVGSTLGACGKTVVISPYPASNIPPYTSKDGYSVCNAFTLDNEIENTGALLIKGAAQQTVLEAGDGTTSSTVIAQSIVNIGLKKIDEGANPQELKSGIDKAVINVCETLKSLSDPIDDNNGKIRNIAIISANNDVVIGGLIADVYKKIGTDGILQIKDGKDAETKIEVSEGVEIDRGYISPDFSNNKEKMIYEAVDANVLICDYILNNFQTQLVPLFMQMDKKGITKNPLIIIAQDFDGEAWATLRANTIQGNLNCCLIKYPNVSYGKQIVEDISILTGATVISSIMGLNMENALVEHLGKTPKVIISEQKSTIYAGGDKVKIEEHRKAIKVQLEDITDATLKEVWEMRLGKISGKMGIIIAGGATPIEARERKDRIDDACRAVKSAIEEGVVPGGGVSLIRCIDNLNKLKETVFGDEIAGVEVIIDACKAPLIKMLENAGLEKTADTIFLGVRCNTNPNWGYNVKTKEYQDLVENGVIDPAKVVRCSLQNAASVAGAILTSDYSLIEMKAK